MVLESIDRDKINIKSLVLEEPRRSSDARSVYEALKASPLYDPVNKRWFMYMKDEGVDDLFEDQPDQILGVVVESFLNPESINTQREEIRRIINEVDFRDTSTRQSDCDTTYRLWSIFAENLIDRDQAQRDYAALKSSHLYDRHTELWYPDLDDYDQPYRFYQTETQLVGILVEHLFNPDEARKMYDKLKSLGFLDQQTGIWYSSMEDESKYRGFANDQLDGVLIEALFDKRFAAERFEELKQMPRFFDPSKNVWRDQERNPLTDEVRGYSYIYSHIQLTGILAVAMFEGIKTNFNKQIPSMPEIRKF